MHDVYEGMTLEEWKAGGADEFRTAELLVQDRLKRDKRLTESVGIGDGYVVL